MWASIVAALTFVALGFASEAQAASLQVSPVSVEVEEPDAAATLLLQNNGPAPLNAQIRVFRWTQDRGEEHLQPTDEVVASPPIAALQPGTDYTVRLVRITKEPLLAGESYRLFVDEIPNVRTQQNRSVALVIRYSIPVFFYPRGSVDASLAWSIEEHGGRFYVSATNRGDRHVRLSALSLHSAGGKSISFGKGLTGYILGRSSMRWAAPGNAAGIGITRSIAITAQSNFGPINASPSVRPAR